jgi:hypothetical protein
MVNVPVLGTKRLVYCKVDMLSFKDLPACIVHPTEKFPFLVSHSVVVVFVPDLEVEVLPSQVEQIKDSSSGNQRIVDLSIIDLSVVECVDNVL